MMEDPLLHFVFLENQGLDTILNVMKSALLEKNYQDYPDSIIPIISILTSLCLYNTTARRDLVTNLDLYYNILRGIKYSREIRYLEM